ncbi:MAG: flagellar biosynthetic protein FliR [Simkaniaceae bacterium]
MDFNYLGFIFTNPHLTPIGVLSIFLLIFIRIIPILVIAPFLGAKLIPGSIRIGFAIALTFIILPIQIVKAVHDIPFDLMFIILSIKELLIGFIMGFLATVPFYIASTSGTIIDYQRGSSSMMSQDITMQMQSSSLGILYNNMLLVLFFQIGGVFFFITALLKSFDIIPVNEFINPNFFNLNMPIWKTSVGMLHHLFSMAIQLAAPAMVAILMAEAFLGIANRLAPQVQIAFLGLSLKSFVGLLMLLLSWSFILKMLGKTSFEWLIHLQDILNNFNPIPL